jgi:hypothetical protein
MVAPDPAQVPSRCKPQARHSSCTSGWSARSLTSTSRLTVRHDLMLPVPRDCPALLGESAADGTVSRVPSTDLPPILAAGGMAAVVERFAMPEAAVVSAKPLVPDVSPAGSCRDGIMRAGFIEC